MRDSRSDHDILVCIEQKVVDLRGQMDTFGEQCHENQRELVKHSEQMKTIYHNFNNHKKRHVWRDTALLTITGITVAVIITVAEVVKG